jgi:predicted amidophosphoribosyltransferase
MNLLQSILDLFFPIESFDKPLSPNLKAKSSLNKDYQINVILDYGDIEDIIHRIKNDGEFAVAQSLNAVFNQGFVKIVENLEFDKNNSVITFVPPDPERSLRQEFCLAKFLGLGASRELGLKFEQLLFKPKSTAKQSYLNREQRIQNMGGQSKVFKLHKSFDWSNVFDFGGSSNGVFNPKKYDTIFLVDDIVTTGATIESCYQALSTNYLDSRIVVVVLASNY